MENVKYLSFALIIALLMGACSDDSGSTGPEPPPENLEEATAEKQFVYNSMNYWYYWQDEVADLADDRFESDQTKQNYLNGFSDAETLFEDLQFVEDDFSFFIEDYEEFNDRQDGILSALGFEYSFIEFQNTDRLVGYVQYVIPGSPADDANLERLQLFTEVDGTQLNTGNALELLSTDETHELTLADIESSEDGLSFPETGTVNIASEQVIEDPVYFTDVLEIDNTRIAYMMYNAFRANSHSALNDAFGDFQSQNADELVLDLRYNPGGTVITSQLLSSLISGRGCSDLFSEFEYSPKRSDASEPVYFLDEVPLQNEGGEFRATPRDGQCDDFENTEPLNSLNLNRVYVLVSRITASASEALINSLQPYIDVKVIGEQTIGKDEGSLTLYDAPEPYTDVDQANPDHKKAIQPIVLKIVNSNGEDYPDGFTPTGNDNINEVTVENLQAKPEIGSPEDPLLARAISLITGQPMAKRLVDPADAVMRQAKMRKDGTNLRPGGSGMYIEPYMMPDKSQ